MAFGTGYHPTTYTCLEALEDIMEPGMTVLDLGVGSGILTIAAARLGADNVLALDIDSIAIRTARQNFRRLGILHRVKLVQGTLPNPLAHPGEFDIVVANISSRAIRERAPHILPLLNRRGALIASGIINDQSPQTEAALEQAGFIVQNTWPRDEWVSLVCRSSRTSA
jgi:ribosomal protein L11 methyltransferase